MSEHEQLLTEIEAAWPSHIHRGLSELIERHPDEEFYAAAFWLFYCDYTVIHPPAFGVNAESLMDGDMGGDGSWRYQPPEWQWDVVDTIIAGMMPLYLRLSEAMRGQSRAAWDSVEESNKQLIGRVARSVTEAVRHRAGAFSDVALPKTFVVFAVDVREGTAEYNRLLRLSVEEGILPTLNGILANEQP